MEQLAGRVAVVTGGASGIGLAMAQRLAAEGMRIVLADIERAVLAHAGDELARSGADVLTVPADVSLAADVEVLAATTLEHFGDVHLVCNNAGVGSRGLPIAELPLEDFSWVLGVNLFGVIHGIRSFLPHLLRNGVGHIVNTASMSGLYHLPRMGPYNASKAAVIALSARRCGSSSTAAGSGVSVLCPSWVRTNISTSDRNRPERFAYALDGEQMAQAAAYKAKRREQLATLALDPAAIAEQVRRRRQSESLLRDHPPRERRRLRGAGAADPRRRQPGGAAAMTRASHPTTGGEP